MKYTAILLLLPALLCAQEFEFQQEVDTIPVQIRDWYPFQPFFGGFSESAPGFCDIDSDGDLDLFVGQYQNSPIPYFENIGFPGNPNFSWEMGFNDSMKSIDDFGHTNPDFFDLDNDGDLDVLVGSGYVTFLENLGTITQPNFNSLRIQLFDTIGNWVFGTHISLFDIDADGDGDLICGEYQGHLQFYRNVGTPDSFAFYLEDDNWLGLSVGNGDEADPTFCDIDVDGDYDLFIGEEEGNIWY